MHLAILNCNILYFLAALLLSVFPVLCVMADLESVGLLYCKCMHVMYYMLHSYVSISSLNRTLHLKSFHTAVEHHLIPVTSYLYTHSL